MVLMLLVSPLPGYGAGPAPTDTLVVALSTLESETFLPWNGGGGRSPYLAIIYDYLVYLDPVTRETKPGLATKWEIITGWEGLDLLAPSRRSVSWRHGGIHC